jgi:hypothetical protein
MLPAVFLSSAVALLALRRVERWTRSFLARRCLMSGSKPESLEMMWKIARKRLGYKTPEECSAAAK